MNKYAFLERKKKNQTLLVVEGMQEKKELLTLLVTIFPEISIEMENVHVYGTDIYDLYHEIEKEYDYDWYKQVIDIDIPFLISRKNKLEEKMEKRDFSNIILVFDYEHHDNFYSDDKILRMQRHFNNASGDGVLYINYPMYEACFHFKTYPDTNYIHSRISLDDCNPGKKYKSLVANESVVIKYLKKYISLIEFLYKKNNLTSTDTSYIIQRLINKDYNKLDDVIEEIIEKYEFEPKKANSLRYSIPLKVCEFDDIKENLCVNMREVLIYIATENIKKAYCVQKGALKDNSIKEMYKELDGVEILKRQNISSSDGLIWILGMFFNIVGEYKFFWDII